MEYTRFWKESADWPRDTATHVFLGRALHMMGKSLFPDKWTGDEPIAEPVPLIPEQWKAQRRDRLEAHRILAGDPMYTVKSNDQRFPGSLTRGTPGGIIIDYTFTELEWRMAREIQLATIEERRPSWYRLDGVRKALAEHATFGRLRTGARKKGDIVITPILADAWAVWKLHEVFAYCSVPLREGASPGTAPIFVDRADLDLLTTAQASVASEPRSNNGLDTAPSEASAGDVTAEPSPADTTPLPTRKRGALGFSTSDRPLIEEMRRLVETEGLTRNAAAEVIMAERGTTVAGTGNRDSKAKRLRDGYNRDRTERGLGAIGD